jgi:hypothetical protein
VLQCSSDAAGASKTCCVLFASLRPVTKTLADAARKEVLIKRVPGIWRARLFWFSLSVSLLLLAGFSLRTIYSVRHSLYREFLYSVVARRVTRGTGSAASRQAAVERLHEFVYLNVRTPYPWLIYDSPADVLIRGFGYCDQAVLVFIHLLDHIGVSGRQTLLKRADGVSPHTVSEVFLDEEWRVFDTLYGFVPRRLDGQPAAAVDFRSMPELLKFSRVDPAWYRNTEVTVTLGSGGSESHQASTRGDFSGLVAWIPDWLAGGIQDLYLLLRPPTYTTTTGKVVEDYRNPDSRLFFKARNFQVFLRARKTEAAYEELLRRYPSSDYADDALYELALLRLSQLGDPESALATLEVFFKQHPSSPWTGDARYLQGRAEEERGNCGRAAALYAELTEDGSNGMEDARMRLARLHCP